MRKSLVTRRPLSSFMVLITLSCVSSQTLARDSEVEAIMRGSEEFSSLQSSGFWGSVNKGHAVCPDTMEYTIEDFRSKNPGYSLLGHFRRKVTEYHPYTKELAEPRFLRSRQWIHIPDQKISSRWSRKKNEKSFVKKMISMFQEGEFFPNDYKSTSYYLGEYGEKTVSLYSLEKQSSPDQKAYTIVEAELHDPNYYSFFTDTAGNKHPLELDTVHTNYVCPPKPKSSRDPYPWMGTKHPLIKDSYAENPIFFWTVEVGAIGDESKDFESRPQIWIFSLLPTITFSPTPESAVAL
ncbi:hypothetical protein N9Z36_09250 [Luminiphilus sp.]|nr:hypothetical protein [Luminiphilus sp.]